MSTYDILYYIVISDNKCLFEAYSNVMEYMIICIRLLDVTGDFKCLRICY